MNAVARFVLTLLLMASTPRLGAESADDADWKALEIIVKSEPKGELAHSSAELVALQYDMRSALLRYYDAHPADARRWVAAVMYIQKDRFRENDEAGGAEHGKKVDELLAAIAAGRDVPVPVREFGVGYAFARACARASVPADLGALGRQFDEFSAGYPYNRGQGELTEMYLEAVQRVDLASAPGIAAKLATSSNAIIANEGARVSGRLSGLQKLTDFKFTALDGREVDLVQLRGKVVLIEFWATWCGACVGDMPRVKAAYQKYNRQGFEIVGIALERTGLSPKDPAPERRRRAALAQAKLREFVQKQDLEWPQFFDERGFDHPLALACKISALPKMFLLDRKGRVVSTTLTAADLDATVKTWLGL